MLVKLGNTNLKPKKGIQDKASGFIPYGFSILKGTKVSISAKSKKGFEFLSFDVVETKSNTKTNPLELEINDNIEIFINCVKQAVEEIKLTLIIGPGEGLEKIIVLNNKGEQVKSDAFESEISQSTARYIYYLPKDLASKVTVKIETKDNYKFDYWSVSIDKYKHESKKPNNKTEETTIELDVNEKFITLNAFLEKK